MTNITAYVILIIAVGLGTAANGFAKGAQGFTLFIPSVLTAITIVGCMYTLSLVMKSIPVGITYASFAGLCIIATTIVGIYKFIILICHSHNINHFLNHFISCALFFCSNCVRSGTIFTAICH